MLTRKATYTTDAELVEGCKKGKSSAQQVVYDRFAGKMFVLCQRYLPDQHEAEDVMINGFMKVFDKIASYTGEGNFEGWIRRIMVNESLMALRRKPKAYHVEVENADAEFSDYEVESALDAAELLGMLQQLPTGYRTVFNLYVIEGYNHAEIAEMLSISEGTSKSQLNKARAMLQRMIEVNQSVRLD